jgi:UDP:flavonoid glycosyltransferase YjiC (YdhE family)
MASILFVTWDGGGNLPPALGIAAELQERGNRVRFLGHEGNRVQVEDRKIGFTVFEKAHPFTSLEPHTPVEMMAIFGDRGMGEDLLDAVRREPADVVVVDCLLMGAMAAAREAGLTYVPIEHLFDEYLRKGWMAGPLGQSGIDSGLDPYGALEAAPLVLVASLRELDPATRGHQPDNVVYTGPVVSVEPPGDVGARQPAVLVSLSTYNFPGMTTAMQVILDSLADLPVKVVVTTGPVIEAASLDVPANAVVHEYVDHDRLMPEVTLVFGHGGHATTMRALAHDLPIVVLPVHPMLDQTMVGTVVEAAGAGRLVAPDASPDELRPVIEELLADGPHRAAAARLGALVRDARGASTGADLVEQLTRDAERVPSGA